MSDKECYVLSPSQDVSYLQCRYTLFKRVINILTSATFEYDFDYDTMKKAFDLIVERNDCLRIRFFKEKGELKQYFGEAEPLRDIPVLKFTDKTKQDKFIDRTRKKAIDYLHGKVIEPYFIETYDNKKMILLKVCHLVLDIYGINVIYRDLLAVYEALKEGKELPEAPGCYEEVVKHDIERGNNPRLLERNREFFSNLLDDHPEPYYAGLHGPDNPIWQKKVKSHHRGMKMFFVQNDTVDYRHKIDSELVNRVLDYCKEKQCSPAHFLFYTCSLAAARLNGNVRNLLPLCLYNCRVSPAEKACAGSKVQSIASYTRFNYRESFEDNFEIFATNQAALGRYVGFSDRSFEGMLHDKYRSSLLETYYFLTYSFIPFEMPEGVKLDIYSNGKGALPAYVVQLLDPKTNEITMVYDVQTKIISEEQLRSFHEMYLKVIRQVLDDPKKELRDIEI